MKKFAQILNGRAHWIFEFDDAEAEAPEFAPSIKLIDITDQVPMPQEGWTFSDGAFVAPVLEAAPIAAVTMRQARLALLAAGKLGQIDAAIDSLPSPQKEAARIEWEYSQEVHRQKPLVLDLAPLLGLDDAALDALFVAASKY